MESFIINKSPDIYKGFLFAVSIALILYLFPHEGKFKYEYQKGKPWMHEDLIAPFDFSIKKTNDELNKEKESVLNNSKTYFRLNDSVSLLAIDKYKKEFDSKWNQETTTIAEQNENARNINYKLGLSILDSIYKKGIIEKNKIIEDKSADYYVVVINNKNEAFEKPLNSIYTIQSAFAYIQKRLPELKKDSDKQNIKLNSSVLQQALNNSIEQNIFFDNETTNQIRQSQLDNILVSNGMKLKGERIISQGELVNNADYKILESLRNEYEGHLGRANYYLILSGQFLILAISLMGLILFLYNYRRDIWADSRKIMFILLLFTTMVIIAIQVLKWDSFSIYIVPFCILSIILRTFFDSRTALFVYIIAILIVDYLAPNSYEFVLLQIIAGIISIFSLINMQKRASLFYTAFAIFLTYSIAYFAIAITQEGNIESINTKYFSWFAINSILTLLAYPLTFVLEKIFGLISEVTLLELSDTNSKVLKELAEKAPGTFQHSLLVASLSENAISEIGGNALLARAGALHHDIGKIDMPMYFIENQSTEFNPHDDLSFEESAKIVISHVINGIKNARKYNIPEQVIDFIRTHHGTSKTQFFYKNYLKETHEKDIERSTFTYKGPIPFSKETAVLMMADAIEAASRSMKKPNPEAIHNLVENVINNQIENKQFINADITFRDISKIKKLFKKRLMNIYHIRIEYPK